MIESKIQPEEVREITTPTREEIFAPDLNEFYGSHPRNIIPSEPSAFPSGDAKVMYPADNSVEDTDEVVSIDTSDEGELPPTTLYRTDSL